MSDTVEPLVLDLLEWIGREPRPYSEVLEVWRTSCPRLPVWENAISDGLVQLSRGTGSAAAMVTLTPRGRALLANARTPT